MNNPKSPEAKETGVQFNNWTGEAYVDIREVIESELDRIMAERAKRHRSTSSAVARNPDDNRNDRSGTAS